MFQKMFQTKKARTILSVVLAAVAAVLLWFLWSYVVVDGTIYKRHLETLDLQGQEITPEHYDKLHRRIPDTDIRWDVPFQGGKLPNDTETITLTDLAHEDLDLLAYLPRLQKVEAEDCEKYAILEELKARYPQCRVHYDVTLGERSYSLDTVQLNFNGDDVTAEELNANLAWLPQVTRIRFNLPDPKAVPAAEIYALQENYPDITVTWTQKIYGQTPDTDVKELDISDSKPASLQEVEELAAYFPNIEKLIMCNTGFENEEMAAFRDKMRPEYKVVWLLHIGKMEVRSDETAFMPGKGNKPVRNGECYNMRYLEDLIAVDVGHQGIQDLDWVVGTPHLKYLVAADGGPKDLTPLSCLKELVYLEVFTNRVKDLTPLVGCTALEDLNVSNNGVEIDALLKMPWLKNLWISRNGLTLKEREALTKALPNTHIDFTAPNPTAHFWRRLPNYYAMRDALGMWYMD